MANKKQCPWCDFNPFCGQESDCDFRSLRMQKTSIIARIKKEVDEINKLKMEVLVEKDRAKQEDIFRTILDKAKGIEIMVSVLKSNYGMADSEIRPIVQRANMSAQQRLKMISQIARLQRGSK